MDDLSQFERVSAWLRGQKRTFERVELGQVSAAELINTAEYELGSILRDLKNLELEPGKGIALLADSQLNMARAVQVAAPDVPAIPESDTNVPPAVEQAGVKRPRSREIAPLLARLKDVSSDAA